MIPSLHDTQLRQLTVNAFGQQRVHPLRAAAVAASLLGTVWLRAGWPWLMSGVQSTGAARRFRRVVDWHCRLRVQAAALGWVALLLWAYGPTPTVAVAALPAVAALGVAVGRPAYRHSFRRARPLHGNEGWASYERLQDGVSAGAVRRAAVDTRRSVKTAVTGTVSGRVSQRRVAGLPVAEGGTTVGRTAVGPPLGVACYAAHRDAVGGIAPPQSLKTATAATQIIDHPGPVLCTQTKPETYRITHKHRERTSLSGRVELLDPEGLTGRPSTIRFAPQAGCRNPLTAEERAGAMVGAVDPPGENGTWFLDQAAVILRVLLMTADVAGLGMDRVHGWASGGDRALEHALTAARGYDGKVPAGWLTAMAGIVNMKADKTKGAILGVLASTVGFMGTPDTAALCLPEQGDAGFDVRRWLADRGTLYLVASDREYAKVGPLLAVFTSYVFEEAKRVATEMPGERLDPPLQMNLDEVANTIPLPLDRWITDAGGRGVQVVWWAQSKSQLRARWGRDGADTVWNSTAVKLVSGGLTVEEDLAELSRLCGDREVGVDQHNRPVTVPKLPVDKLRELPKFHAVLIHKTTPVTIVRITPVWLVLARSAVGVRARTVWAWLRGLVLPVPTIVPPRIPTLVVDVPASTGVSVPERWEQPAEPAGRS